MTHLVAASDSLTYWCFRLPCGPSPRRSGSDRAGGEPGGARTRPAAGTRNGSSPEQRRRHGPAASRNSVLQRLRPAPRKRSRRRTSKKKTRTGREAALWSSAKVRTRSRSAQRSSGLNRRHFRQWAAPHGENLTSPRAAGAPSTCLCVAGRARCVRSASTRRPGCRSSYRSGPAQYAGGRKGGDKFCGKKWGRALDAPAQPAGSRNAIGLRQTKDRAGINVFFGNF